MSGEMLAVGSGPRRRFGFVVVVVGGVVRRRLVVGGVGFLEVDDDVDDKVDGATIRDRGRLLLMMERL